jgi:hypothetical protein
VERLFFSKQTVEKKNHKENKTTVRQSFACLPYLLQWLGGHLLIIKYAVKVSEHYKHKQLSDQ